MYGDLRMDILYNILYVSTSTFMYLVLVQTRYYKLQLHVMHSLYSTYNSYLTKSGILNSISWYYSTCIDDNLISLFNRLPSFFNDVALRPCLICSLGLSFYCTGFQENTHCIY